MGKNTEMSGPVTLGVGGGEEKKRERKKSEVERGVETIRGKNYKPYRKPL